MEEAQLTGEEVKEVVGVFKLLRKWRDERNEHLMEDEPIDAQEEERSSHASEHQIA